MEVRNEQLGAVKPGEGPRTVYVADFALDAENIQSDPGVRGLLPGQSQSQRQGLLGGLGQRLRSPFGAGSPGDKAREIVDAMAAALVKSLSDKGVPAQRIASTAGALPRDGWLVQGMFTEVDEGSRLKRAVIGFGAGATSMDVQVGVSDLAGKDPHQPFIVFGTVKDPSKMPGAVVTMNPYVAAAKFVMEKNATGKDIEKTAEQIVDEILKYRQKFEDEARANRAAP
ncbi:DUF4410 domain-containing protein [Methylococcus mesophilus]|uniref:DUF4410 domain-containing protein n=1 Tax=Methylococcus mesophilus TaxID=2993564 RepID=UPI00224B3457|nr:DUF4410 domain-containing protein [Methylococcus mesophilus]UZR27148.1 DUF4410 domain-containing protein [Methylococcus mesophilus]